MGPLSRCNAGWLDRAGGKHMIIKGVRNTIAFCIVAAIAAFGSLANRGTV